MVIKRRFFAQARPEAVFRDLSTAPPRGRAAKAIAVLIRHLLFELCGVWDFPGIMPTQTIFEIVG